MRISMPSGNNEDYINAARLIDAIGSAPWLPEHLRSWTPGLFLDRGVHKKQPTRAQMRSLLQDVERAAALLGHALEPGPIREFLEGHANGPFPNLSQLHSDLGDLAARARRAADSEALATKSGLTKPGPGKAVLAGAILPKTYCALLVSETWRYLHGVEPRPKTQKALAAAEALWSAADGDPHSCGDEPLARWRHHFALARKADQKELRAEHRRHLVERESWWNLLHGSTDRVA
ncbi:MAG: hypothetical protein WAU78_04475 [Roseiarcus sp.]